MAKRCATLDEFLAQVPEFRSFGPKSVGTIKVDTNPAPGDTLTISDPWVLPNVVETLEAGVDFAIGATPTDTASNIAAALALSALVDASSVGDTVTLVTKATGPVSVLDLTTSVPLVLILTAFSGGDVQVVFALDCACAQINLECWGIKADCGHIYLTAHFLTVQSGGSGGAVSSKTIDKLSVSYAVAAPSGDDADLQSTSWGRLYAQMRRSLFIAPLPGRRFLPLV